jgi:hypothetical protein
LTYWETRYKLGGTSGPGSVGREREWKWSVISKYIGEGKIQSALDLGCGDLSFWEGRDIPSAYMGIDVSETIVERNQKLWGSRFICSSGDKYYALPKCQVVLCLDVLFHIMDEETYVGILQNLVRYSSEWIFVYTWSDNPFEHLRLRLKLSAYSALRGRIFDAPKRLADKSSDGRYERYRRFEEYLEIFEAAGFSLVSREKDVTNAFGSMYVFQKR